MSILILCQACTDRPAHQGTWLCDECTDQLHGDLHAAPERWADLDVERCRLSRKGAAGGPTVPSGGRALPYSPEASAAQDAILAALRNLGHLVGVSSGGDGVRFLTDVLAGLEPKLVTADGIGVAAYRLQAANREAARLCDLPREKRTYLGLCDECQQPMRTTRTAGWHTCCGRSYDVEEAQAATVERLRDPDLNYTQTEAAIVLGISVNAVKQRVKHRKVEPVIDGRKGKWYRLGDIA